MTVSAIGLRRLWSQQVTRPASACVGEVVARLGAVQAQDYLGALWAVGLRTIGATEESVERALAEGTIVRTWPMRGTIHFVAAADARWMLELLAPRVVRGAASRRAQLGLDEATIAASAVAVSRALEGGRRLTRNALYEVLERANIAAAGSRGLHILGRLAHDRLVCFGAREGKQPTFALFDEWAPGAKSLPADEAIAALTLRYFKSHGPATAQDFMWWSGLTSAEVKAGLAAAGEGLGHERIEGKDYYFDPALPPEIPAPPGACLLPPFDEFLVAYRDRGASLDPQYNNQVVPGGNGIFNPIVVIGGRVVGTWKRELKKDRVALTFSPFATEDSAHAETVAVAAQRYAAFLGKQEVIMG